jgi:hypothetical protein
MERMTLKVNKLEEAMVNICVWIKNSERKYSVLDQNTNLLPEVLDMGGGQ